MASLLVRGICGLVLVWYGVIFAAPIKIDKCFFHTNPQSSRGPVLESLVFYLSDVCKPMLLSTSVDSCLREKRVYRLSNISFDRSVLSRFPLHSDYGYDIAIHQRRSYIEVSIVYDPRHCVVMATSFDSIGNQPAVGFHIMISAPPVKAPVFKSKSVVIDCGHGGTDSGAIGVAGVMEKEITRLIGIGLKNRLQTAGVSVILIRDSDVSISLDERTLFANTYTPDLFISLHANYAQSKTVSGIETWVLSNKFTIIEPHSATALIFEKQIQDKIDRSVSAANKVHASLVSTIKRSYPTIVNRGVKHAISQILLGVQSPAILVELGFLSHSTEEQLLNSAEYQKLLVEGIARGILDALGL